MKYTISINQKQAIELGLTNINQLFIFDLLISAQSWAKTIIIEGETHYWVARQAIADQLPILNLKPDTVYRHLKELTKLGLIDYAKHGNMDCINITDKGKSYSFGSKSEDSEVDNEQLGSKPQDKTEADPTYKTTTSISLLDNNTKSSKHDINAKIVIDHLNKKSGFNYRHVDSHLKHINARLEEGYILQDVIHVIDAKVEEWEGTKMEQYLRPATLF
ncbi:unnamed protein product, partial [marine sediment metagenome]